MKYFVVIIVSAVLFLFSCESEKRTYKLIYSAEEPMGEIAKVLKEVVEKNVEGVELELIIGAGSYGNLDSITERSADFAIIENHMPFSEDVNSLFPLYPQILHIFYRSDSVIYDFKDLIYGKRVFIGLPGSGTFRFMKDLFVFFELDETKFSITENPWDNDVFCGFTDIIKPEYLSGFGGSRLYSFDDISAYGRGSVAEGVSMRYPQVKPFVIPVKTYGALSTTPILTMATDAILVCSADLPEEVVYGITKAVFHFHQEFTAISPLLFLDLHEQFDREKLNYPLANGSRIYLDRDEPGVLERYAELFGVFFSIGIALISAILSLSKWRKQRKKDRVDVFYGELMQIKNELPSMKTVPYGAKIIAKIKKTQDRAFKMLIDEELVADESFRIYMELSKETINEVKLRAQQIKRKQGLS